MPGAMIIVLTLAAVAFYSAAIVSTVLVLNPKYHDNLIQRVGLSVIALGCVAQGHAILKNIQCFNALTAVVGGLLVFSVGLIAKRLWRTA